MSAKKYLKKPVEVEAWIFPDNCREQYETGAQLNDADIETHFYDYAVQKSDTRFRDGAYWRWTAVHLEYRGDRFIAFIGDVIILDPLEGVRVVKPDIFAATYEVPTNNETAADEHHSVRELYDYRMAYNSLLFNQWARDGKYEVHKSWRHGDGEKCFGGGWFIVSATTPYGQVTNHYSSEHWSRFHVPIRERAAEWDGHTPQQALDRLIRLTEVTA